MSLENCITIYNEFYKMIFRTVPEKIRTVQINVLIMYAIQTFLVDLLFRIAAMAIVADEL